jgi:putative acetyltransferase
MFIQRERPGDASAVAQVVGAAFGPPEVRLVEELRTCGAWLLSFVALDGTAVVGHVLGTRARVGPVPVLALGPLGVRPDRQRRGYGSALVHALLGAADALDEPLVGVLGDPGYYGRFGFRPSGSYGITPPLPAWAPHFQVRTLTRYDPSTRGAFAYVEPFVRHG